MSAPGKFCMFTVRPNSMAPWCGARGVTVRHVPARDVNEDGRVRRLPAYEETLCAEHARDQVSSVS